MALVLGLGIVCIVGYALREIQNHELFGLLFAALVVLVTLACILFT